MSKFGDTVRDIANQFYKDTKDLLRINFPELSEIKIDFIATLILNRHLADMDRLSSEIYKRIEEVINK